MDYSENVQIELKREDGSFFKFPQNALTVKRDVQMILPFNMDLAGLNLTYATAQPLCRLTSPEPVYVFFAPEGVAAEYCFKQADLKSTEVNDAIVTSSSDNFIIKVSNPGTDCTMKLTLANGKVVKIITLNHLQALNAWKATIFGAERLFLSSRDLIFYKDKIRFQSTGTPEIKFSVYPGLSSLKFSAGESSIAHDGVFSALTIKLPEKILQPVVKEVNNLKTYQNTGKRLPLDDRPAVFNAASPGPQYQTNLKEVPGSRYYEVFVPGETLSGLSDAFLSFDYTGDTGAAYLNGKLIADDFYSGPSMLLGIKRFSSTIPGKKLLFQVVPLTDERQIYFEDGVRDSLQGKVAAELKSVGIIPQYEVFVSSGK
jgi:hypothetical protein